MIDNHDLGYMVSHSNPRAMISFAYLPYVASFWRKTAAFVRDTERERERCKIEKEEEEKGWGNVCVFLFSFSQAEKKTHEQTLLLMHTNKQKALHSESQYI